MQIESLDYHLPPRLIATCPAKPRDAARLMVVSRGTRTLAHHRVFDLADGAANLLRPGDLLIMNRTKVLPARFCGSRASTGGRVGGLYLGSDGLRIWEVMLESRGRLTAGDIINLDGPGRLTLQASHGGGRWSVQVDSTLPPSALLQQVGSVPLPPYIRRQRRLLGEPETHPDDLEQYNTVFGDQPGSIAAPTASLHFTPGLLDRLKKSGVRIATLCLHVGIGTFAPIRTAAVENHQIHEESISVPRDTITALHQARAEGRRIIPIGTTAVRAVESLPDPLPPGRDDFHAATDLYIHPEAIRTKSFRFRFTDALMTNFHLPRSSLLALVAALPGVGADRLLDWYGSAVEADYRFYSYGDAMLLN